MAHTPLFDQLIHAFRVAGESVITGKPVDQILEEQSWNRMSRREFIGASALAGVILTGLPDPMRKRCEVMEAGLSPARFPTTFVFFTAAVFAHVLMSMRDSINMIGPGGQASPLGQLLDVSYNIEYGAEIDVQSSINLLYLLGF